MELSRHTSPLVEEPARVIECLPPLLNRDVLALQPRPSIEVGLRHAVRSQALAFPKRDFIGPGLGRYASSYAIDFSIWNFICFYT